MTNHQTENETATVFGNNEMADRLRRDPQAIKQPTETIEAAIILQLEDVESRVDPVIKSYWETLKYENAQRTNLHEQSRLGVRKRLRRQSMTFEWFATQFYKHDGEQKAKWVHIDKPRGTNYNLNTLKKHCKGWEVDLVFDTEERLREFRKEVVELLDMRRSLKTIAALRATSPGSITG